MYPKKAEEEIELVGEHASGCFHKNVIQMEVLPKSEDYTNAMHQFVCQHDIEGHNLLIFESLEVQTLLGYQRIKSEIVFIMPMGVFLVVMLFQRLSVNILYLSKLVFSATVLLLLMRRGCSV